MFESCVEIRSHFSDYVDGLCSRDVLRSIQYHIGDCAPCRDELEGWQALRPGLRTLPQSRVPEDLKLRLRVRLSQELHRNPLVRLWVRLENALQPVMLPASAGMLMTAILCFGLILGAPAPQVASTPDVPLDLVKPPRLVNLAPLDFNTGDQPLVLVTHVNAGGRVDDYKVLSGPASPELRYRLDRLMYFSVFDPATTFGRPIGGQVVLSLKRITVRG